MLSRLLALKPNNVSAPANPTNDQAAVTARNERNLLEESVFGTTSPNLTMAADSKVIRKKYTELSTSLYNTYRQKQQRFSTEIMAQDIFLSSPFIPQHRKRCSNTNQP
jgi:hypothetical protein